MNKDYRAKVCINAIEDKLVDWELDKVYERAIEEYFKQSFPDFSLDHNYSFWEVESVKFKISYDATLEEIEEAFEKHISNFAGGKDSAKLRSAFSYSVSTLYYKGNGTLINYARFDNGIQNLFYILDYVINGVVGKDLGKVNQIMKDHNISSSLVGIKETFKEFGGIQIITFQNGKIVIKGLSSEEEETLKDLFNIAKK